MFTGRIRRLFVVGYNTKSDTVQGFNFYAPQFQAVGNTAGVNIQDIKLDFGEGESTGVDNIQVLDEGGATIATYTWMPADWFGGEQDGWVDEDFVLANVTLSAGQGVLVDIVEAGTSIVNAGQVADAPTTVTGVQGFNFIGNNSPVAINIQDIKLDFVEGESTGVDNIQILDEGGATTATYTWMPADWFGGEQDGWVDEDFALADVTIQPGAGFLVDIVDAGTKVIIPSAL